MCKDNGTGALNWYDFGVQESGEWVPSQANFTSLATPNAIGSGKTALNTLLHEGISCTRLL